MIRDFPTVTKWHLSALQTTGAISIALASMGSFDGRVVMQNNQVAGTWQLTETNPVLVSKIENGDGAKKLFFSLFGLGCGIAAYALREIKESQEEERAIQQANLREARSILEKVEREKLLMDADEELKAYAAIAEGKAIGKTAQTLGVDPSVLLGEPEQPPINVPAQAVNQALPMQQGVTTQQELSNVQPQTQSTEPQLPVIPAVVPQQVIHPVQAIQQATPIAPQKHYAIPGVELINADRFEDITEYPNIMIIAGKGDGKTTTVNYIFKFLSGKKVFASPKANRDDLPNYSAVFGYNPKTDLSGWYGDPTKLNALPARDITYLLNNPDEDRSMIDFAWGIYSEIMNRQAKGKSYYTSLGALRTFFDEASITYSTGFLDPFDVKNTKLKSAQQIISTANKTYAFDGRTQLMQGWFAAQTKSVAEIGMEGISETRDAMWFLYPGKKAQIRAEELKMPQLKMWLEQRDKQGYGAALIEKEGVIVQVLNLPTKEELMRM